MPHSSAAKGKAEPTGDGKGEGAGASAAYDCHYFAHCCDTTKSGSHPYERNEHWLGFFGRIADHLVQDIGPAKVLDAGCAMGFLVEALRDRGVEAYGIDISEYALAQVRPDIKQYCRQGSVTEPFPTRYDLIVSIEVLEHLAAEDAIRAVSNFCSSTADVIFSSSPDDYREATHLNVQPPEWWAETFARNQFFRDVDYDPSSYISPQAVRYRSQRETVARTVAGYERLLWRVKSENLALRRMNDEHRAEVDHNQQMADELERIKRSRAWKVQSSSKAMVNRVFPAGSPRGQWLRRRLKGSKTD